MSLSSFLLPTNVGDSGLDAIFRSNAINAGSPPSKDAKSSTKRTRSDPASNSNAPAKRARQSSSNNALSEQKGSSNFKSRKEKPEPQGNNIVDEEDSDAGSHDLDRGSLIHESLQQQRKRAGIKGPRKVVYVPPDETLSQRNLRTIFVGNLAASVAQKKQSRKELQRHIISFVPSAKIESVRFRSIPFQTPSSKLPTSDDEAAKPARKSQPRHKADDEDPQGSRRRSQDRASAWRERRDDEELKNDQKKFLTPDQKKKISFINQDFHSSADTMNAYVVFAHPTPNKDSLLVPPQPGCMDPYDAARLAAEKVDGTLFMERVIRVDVTEKSGGTEGDPKFSIFVGNLDFAATEEDVRAYFEGVVSAERGPPLPADDQPSCKSSTWVTRVRIIRDKETQLGKGFGYVQFLDRECVDELLAIEEGTLKFAKRKLRIQRCKTIPGSTSRETKSLPSKGEETSYKLPVPAIPKGDPLLGERIASLSKEGRKKAKASDADRIARRLAKKKARNALSQSIKPLAKDRTRVRKSQPIKAAKTGSTSDKPRKGRIRSDKASAKRNVKK